jgi:hypothetical protein
MENNNTDICPWQTIYADTDVCRWNIGQLNYLGQLNLQLAKDLAAGAPAVFHWPCPYDPNFSVKIKQAVDLCSRVVILVSELHADTVEFIINHQHPKIKYFICGFVEGYTESNWMDWFITTCYFYKSTDLLDKLNPYAPKSKSFDILLGWQKPHRDAVYNYINDNNLSDQVIMTYFTDRSKSVDQQGIWDVNLPAGTFHSITQVTHSGKNPTLSQLINVDIYNSTAYTVVCETNADDHYSFYTEKIVKPILAERLFIVISGQHYLRNLRKLGFKTFEGIIDETYDTVQDHNLRFALACEQIEYLTNQPQEEILAKIRPITEHNKKIMFETDWYGNFARELQAALLSQLV